MIEKFEPINALSEEELTKNYFIGFRTDLGIKFIYLQNKGFVIKDKIEETISVFQEGDENSDIIFKAVRRKFPLAQKLPVLEFYNQEKT